MKNQILLGVTLFCGGAVTLATSSAPAHAQTAATESNLASITLPAGTVRFAPKDVPREITDALQDMMAAGGDKVKRGRTEVLGRMGEGYKKSSAPAYKAKVAAAMKRAGWEYEEGEKSRAPKGPRWYRPSRLSRCVKR
jgi:hypothetical protein